MAKETTKNATIVSACEQYVVDELRQAKNDLVCLQNELKLAKEKINKLEEKNAIMLSKLLVIFNDSGTHVEHGESISSVYVLGGFVGCYSHYGAERGNIDDVKLKTLADLIEQVQRTPIREE